MSSSKSFDLKYDKLIILAISIFLFIYLIFRATNLSLTYDESYTFLNYVKAPLVNAFIYFNPNNHFLNTILIKISTHLFGNSELAIRLPNLIGAIFYMGFTYLFLKNNFKRALIIPIFLILNFNPYQIEFFSLARGYGLSISLIMISLYFFSYLFKSYRIEIKYLLLSTFFGMLSVLANLTSLNFYLALILIIFVLNFYKLFIIQKKEKNFKNIFDFIINWWSSGIYLATILLIALLAVPVILMKIKNQLYFGGGRGFLQDTVSSLIKDFFYNSTLTSLGLNIALFFVLFIIGVSLIFFVSYIYKNNKKLINILPSGILLILLISIASSTIQNLVLKTNYLIDRTALFFLLLFLLVLSILINLLFIMFTKQNTKLFIIFLSYFLAFLFTLNFYNNFNLKSSLEWRYDSNTKKAFKDSLDYTQKLPLSISKLNLCTTNLYLPTLKYYNYIKKDRRLNLNILEIKEVTNNKLCDLYYLNKESFKNININFNIISSYTETDTSIISVIN